MCVKTWLYTKLFGQKIGSDEYGNIYYETKKIARCFQRKNRWVYYKGLAEGSKVPVSWFSWLHYQTDKVPITKSKSKDYKWELPSTPNLTGTKYAYMPTGHTFSTNKRDKAIGDYQSWDPDK